MTTTRQPPKRGKPGPSSTPRAKAPEKAPSRMTAASILTGRKHEPDRILMYGVEGVGKSTFGAESGGIFIASEDGIGHLDVPRFPTPKSFDEVMDALRTLYTEDLGYPALIIDSVDWVEHLIHEQARREANMTLEKFNSYGTNVKMALDYHRRLLAALSRLREKRAMEVILIAHAQVKDFKNPAGPDYMRYRPNLAGDVTPELYKHWTDTVLFANFEEVVQEGEGHARNKGVDTGRRLAHSERCAAWDAKSRWSIPPEIEMVPGESYAAYVEARREAGVYIEKEASK